MLKGILFAAVIAMMLPACAARTTIEPIGVGNTSYNASLGGPLVEAFGTYLPVPILSAGATHGFSERVDLSGSLYLMPIMLGIVGFDIGATWYPVVDPDATTIAVQPRLLFLASVKSDVEDRMRVYPGFSASGAWRRGDDRVYTGFDLTVPVSKPDYDQDPPPVIFSPFVGYRWALGANTRLVTEIKWVGLNVRTDATTDYVNPFGLGGLAPYVGYEFGW